MELPGMWEPADYLQPVEMDVVSAYPPEIASGRVPVGPGDEPREVEIMTLKVEFTCSDRSILSRQIEIPKFAHAQRMELSARVGTKNLGPIMVTNFYFHDDSRRLHTICRRESDIIDDNYEGEPPAGPEIDILEY